METRILILNIKDILNTSILILKKYLLFNTFLIITLKTIKNYFIQNNK